MWEMAKTIALVLAVGAGLASPLSAATLEINDKVRSAAAAGWALSGDLQAAAKELEEITGLSARDSAFMRIALIAARAGQADAARRFIKEIANLGQRDNAAMDVGMAFAARGMIEQAEALARGLDPRRRQQVRAAIAKQLVEQGEIKAGWRQAAQGTDLVRRRDAYVSLRGGLAKVLSPRAAIGAALGAETHGERIRSLVAVARGLVRHGKFAGALRAISWARQEQGKWGADAKLVEETSADMVLILVDAGDFLGARTIANDLNKGTLKRFLLHHIDVRLVFGAG